jgi:hypothetical protein
VLVRDQRRLRIVWLIVQLVDGGAAEERLKAVVHDIVGRDVEHGRIGLDAVNLRLMLFFLYKRFHARVARAVSVRRYQRSGRPEYRMNVTSPLQDCAGAIGYSFLAFGFQKAEAARLKPAPT